MRSSVWAPTGLRLRRLPLERARARPAWTRSRMISRSSSANTQHMPSMARPIGVSLSSPCLSRNRPTPEARMSLASWAPLLVI
jgi:hypothetical protein